MTGIFGREREIASGEAFLSAVLERPGVLLLEGEAGIGKTAVWRELARRAAVRGFRVLSCRPAQTETKLSLSAVSDLLEAVPEQTLAVLPDPQRRALQTALLRTDAVGRDTDPRALASGVRSALARLSEAAPVLVAVDDWQWLDSASARVLEYVLRRLGGMPVAWLVARRDDGPGRTLIERLMPPESLTSITIGPLTRAALHHMIKSAIEYPLQRPSLVRIHDASGGNPLHALEIARAAEGRSLTVGMSVPVPDSLRTLLSKRVRRLPGPTRDALLTAAALSEPTTALVDERALSAAEEADLIRIDANGCVTFRHPLFASAVYEDASRTRRHDVHRQLAQRLTDPEERARHLAIATTSPDDDVAALLEQGAALARIRGSWESAADLLARAAQLTAPDRPEPAGRRRVAAAEHHAHAGNRAQARALLEATLAEQVPRALRADALRILAEICFEDDNATEAVRVFAQALEHSDTPSLSATIELSLAYVLAALLDWRSAREHAYRALEHARAEGADQLEAQALTSCAMMDFLCGHGVAWDKVDRALALERSDALVVLQRRPTLVAALLILYVGGHDEARRRLRAACVDARERGDESDLAFALLWLSWLETRAGDFAAAAVLAEEASSLATLTGSPSMHAWTLTQQAYVFAHVGAASETRRYCAEASGPVRRSGNQLPAGWVAASLALLELSLGNADAAWQACETLTLPIGEHGIIEPVLAFFLPDAIEALVGLGRLDQAEALLTPLETRAHELDRTWALATAGRCRALLLAARGNLSDALAAIERALAAHERIGLPFDHARALLVKGTIERRARRRTAARDSLRHALSEFDRLGAALWADRTRGELDRLGLRRSEGRELTPSERRTAELAAVGLTNREVAAALFITPKTVEANLSRIYEKLGIRSRAELGARMAERPEDGESPDATHKPADGAAVGSGRRGNAGLDEDTAAV